MNFKMLIMASLAALTMTACAHHSHKGCGKCGEAKKECASGSECPVDKKCDDCKKSEGTGK